jgi:hypothetical protein
VAVAPADPVLRRIAIPPCKEERTTGRLIEEIPAAEPRFEMSP